MNKQAIYHEGDSNLCYPIDKNTITLRLRVAKEDVFDEIKVVYGNKYVVRTAYHHKYNSLPLKFFFSLAVGDHSSRNSGDRHIHRGRDHSRKIV